MKNNNLRHPKEHNNLWMCSWSFSESIIHQVVISAKDKSEAMEALKLHTQVTPGETLFVTIENLNTLLQKGLVAWSGKLTLEEASFTARLSSWDSGGRWDGTDKLSLPEKEDTEEEEEVLDEELIEEVDSVETKEYMESLETV